jgi:hypothetical protein
MLYFVVNLPYVSFVQNYRSGVVHVGMVGVLVMANYYGSLMQGVEGGLRGRRHGVGVVVLGAIGVAVMVSGVVAVWEIVVSVRSVCCQYSKHRKVKSEDKSE